MDKEETRDNVSKNQEDEIQSEFHKLIEIMKKLRGPQGCPWDKEQNYYSLQPYILEEAYEVVEALQNKDISALKSELGDLLLQVVFEAQIGAEEGDFDLGEVLSGINEKLIRRHPHVFSNLEVDSVSEVMNNWDEIKEQEKKTTSKNTEEDSVLEDFSRSNPALMQSYELQKKAAQVGFDWEDISGVIKKVEEEVAEVKEAVEKCRDQELEKEIGDLLFSVVNLARFKKINPELALLSTINKFQKRFKYIEKSLFEKGVTWQSQDLKELEEYWQKAKNKEVKERKE